MIFVYYNNNIINKYKKKIGIFLTQRNVYDPLMITAILQNDFYYLCVRNILFFANNIVKVIKSINFIRLHHCL